MSTRSLRNFELLASALVFAAGALWVTAALTAFGYVQTRGHLPVAVVGEYRLSWLLASFIDLVFFGTVMWQVIFLLRRARSQRQLLRSVSTLLRRIGWLAVTWPVASVTANSVMGVVELWQRHGTTMTIALDLSLTHLAFAFVGVVLLLVRSLVESLRGVHDEMQLVV